MHKIIYIKYGELCLKGKNKKDFLKIAIDNLTYALREFELKILAHYDYVEIESFNDDDWEAIKQVLLLIPGFSYFCLAYKTKLMIDTLCEDIMQVLNTNQSFTFKIEARRSNKKFNLNSDEINRYVAGKILQANKLAKVDVHNPNIRIFIDVKDQFFIFFTQKFNASNGLPVGSSGKVLILLSGGIDSPVAAYKLMSRGFHVDFLTFISPPHTSDKVLEKINMLIEKITHNFTLQKETRLFVCNFSPIQHEIAHLKKDNYRITLLRRSFFRIASMVLDNYQYHAIATGEALGQVASQTVESMYCINSATDKLILRPLICCNKEQIINEARFLNTYEISNLPFDDTCSLFAPKNPVTKPILSTCLSLEKEIDLLSLLEQQAVNKLVIKYFK